MSISPPFGKRSHAIVILFLLALAFAFIFPILPPRKSKETRETIKMVDILGGTTGCAYYPYITYLDLNSISHIDDSVFAELFLLNGLKHLHFLDLSNTRITDETLVFCQEMPNLRIINLSGTFVTRAGIDVHLKNRSSIEILWCASPTDVLPPENTEQNVETDEN